MPHLLVNFLRTAAEDAYTKAVAYANIAADANTTAYKERTSAGLKNGNASARVSIARLRGKNHPEYAKAKADARDAADAYRKADADAKAARTKMIDANKKAADAKDDVLKATEAKDFADANAAAAKAAADAEGFTNYNNTKQSSNHFQGVNVNKFSQLSGSEFQSDKKELVLDLEKDETGHMMSFLLQQNDMNKQVGKKELEEALEKDTEKVVEAEGFSNYKSVELDLVSTFYVGSLSVIMLYYIYRSLRK